MQVRFWGTRGSIAKPGRTTLRYGGNTSCVEVRADDGTLLVLDCGTGAHELSRALVSSGDVVQGHLLISHTHWDHIQGFPFFEPLFGEGNDWEVYAPGGRREQLEVSLAAQMSYDYHPVTLEDLTASVRFRDLTEGVFEVGSIRVTSQYLHHPALTLGYRIEADGATLVYATDHEPHSLYPEGNPGLDLVHHEDRRHVRFLEGADLVIHDAQYVLEEFPRKAGWGHTPIERAVDYAVQAGARRLALYHHDPERDDESLDRLTQRARERADLVTQPLEVWAAAEGQTVELSGEPAPLAPVDRPSALLGRKPPPPQTVLIVDDDPDILGILTRALQPENLRLVSAEDGPSALEAAREEPPALIVQDLNVPGVDGLGVCRSLRSDPDPRLRDVPVLILTSTPLDEDGLLEIFKAGATDFLPKPVKPTLLRSRVSGWLMRTRARQDRLG